MPAVRITGQGDTRQHPGLLVSTLKPAAMVSPDLASKSASAADGARGTIAEFASRLSEFIDGQMDFGQRRTDWTQLPLGFSRVSCKPKGNSVFWNCVYKQL